MPLWNLDQAIRQYLHEAIGRVGKILQERGYSLPLAQCCQVKEIEE